MEDCCTPTFTTPREFLFNVTPMDVRTYQDVHNIMAGRRSFTPLQPNFRSPGLSPIYKLPGSVSSPVTAHHSSSFMEFKKPTYIPKPVITYAASPKYSENSSIFLSPALPGSFSSPSMCSPVQGNGFSPQMEESKSSSVLNCTINIQLLLKTLGLERYCENFERAGIDCHNLMNMKSYDLKKIGIQSDEDRNCIMEMFENVVLN